MMDSQQAGRMMKATKIPMMSGMGPMMDSVQRPKKTTRKKAKGKAKKTKKTKK